MHELPITQVLAELKKHLSQAKRLILQAPPGAGKTTLVPLALLDQEWLGKKQIIMLEPRRLATRNVAARMAQLLGEKVGQTVGYQIRQDKCYSDQTKILVVTEGILTRKLQADPALEEIALVIFDEIHERNLQADLSLAFCLQSQEFLNENLKLLLMSATLDSHKLTDILSTSEEKVSIVSSQGRSFPVDIVFRAENYPQIDRWNLSQIVSQYAIDALTHHQANILIFLPGVREIKQVENQLQSYLSEQNAIEHNVIDQIKGSVIIAPLYGDLSRSQQQQAISPTASGQRKVVLATNIAETSLTIEGISVVIDSGLQREIRFNPGSGMDSLQTTMISQSSAAQRSGRAGRLSAGTCYRLWTESLHKRLPAHQGAEILSADLAPMMLELAQWGVQDVDELNWLDQPPPGTTAQAKSVLESLNAINESGKITAHGKKILSLGIHPRLAHMILRGQAINLAETSCLLAALLTEKDIFRSGSHLNSKSDSQSSNIVERLSVLQKIQAQHTNTNNLVDKKQCSRVLQSAKEFFKRLPKKLTQDSDKNSTKNVNQSYNNMAGVLLAFAYPDRIAKLRNNKDSRYLLSNGKGAVFTNHPLCYDSLANEPYLVIANLHQQSNKTDARIFTAAPIDYEQLGEYFIDLIDEKNSLSWNHKLQKVESVFSRKLGSLILTERFNPITDTTQLQPILFDGIKSLGLDCLPWSKQALQLKQRVQFIHYQKTRNDSNTMQLNQIDLPDFSDDYLLDNLEHWLQPHLKKEASIKQLQLLNLLQILNANINWEQMKQLNELAPEKIKVPSGSDIRIDYSDPASPILAVRLQELFGLKQTPAIIRGSFPLLLHLLSPASRPMQVTQDLASFWENTYNDVKKELRGKYKKHYWPDDPLQAQATHRVKPRKVKS